MRRLYLQVYATLVAVVLLFALAWSWAWSRAMAPHEARMLDGIARIAGDAVPPGAPPDRVRASLARIGEALLADVSLYDRDGALVAGVGEPIPAPDVAAAREGIARSESAYLFHVVLPDGRRLLARHAYEHGHLREIAGMLALLAVAVAVGAWPLARRLTRRLERLRARVDALGAGDLGARVAVEGRDEVADLARSFNAAAARIERLVEAQRTLLAGVSHELRTPLARIRMALALHAPADAALQERVERDVAELDAGIGELLLASRLDAEPELARSDEVDLLALAAEEASRVGAEAGGSPASVCGDARLLRRLVRNLVENASRHGGGSPIEVVVGPAAPGRVRLGVADRGPGVPDAERERVFEPFHRAAGGDPAGLGLGLALVRRIARHHGGDAACRARPGGGTLFEVELPAARSS